MDEFVADQEASCDAGFYQEVSQIWEGNETSAVNTIAREPELPAVGNDPPIGEVCMCLLPGQMTKKQVVLMLWIN